MTAVARGEVASPLVSREKAAELLGTMQGGYNIEPLIELLDDSALAPIAAKALSHTLLMFDNFYDVEEKAKAGNHLRNKCCNLGLMQSGSYLSRHCLKK